MAVVIYDGQINLFSYLETQFQAIDPKGTALKLCYNAGESFILQPLTIPAVNR
jgi:hypothetical protein